MCGGGGGGERGAYSIHGIGEKKVSQTKVSVQYLVWSGDTVNPQQPVEIYVELYIIQKQENSLFIQEEGGREGGREHTFILSQLSLSGFKISIKLSIVTHLYHKVDIVSVLKVVE